MGDASDPTHGGEALTTDVSQSASEAEPDLQSMLADAEAEAADAEAAAAAARARVRAMRSEQTGEQEKSEDSAKRRRWPPSWQVVANTVSAIVIICSLIGSGIIGWQHYKATVAQRQANEFIDTAKEGVVDLTSIDFNRVRDQVQHIIDNSTGSFREDFVGRSEQFIKVAEASKAVAKGTVSAAAVESMKAAPHHWFSWFLPPRNDEAVLLVVGSEEITNAVGNQQPRSFRFRVTVTKDGDQRKVSKLELVL